MPASSTSRIRAFGGNLLAFFPYSHFHGRQSGGEETTSYLLTAGPAEPARHIRSVCWLALARCSHPRPALQQHAMRRGVESGRRSRDLRRMVCTSWADACIDVFLCRAWRPSVRAGLARALLRLGEARPWPCPGADVRLGWAGWGGEGMGWGWLGGTRGCWESCGMFGAKVWR